MATMALGLASAGMGLLGGLFGNSAQKKLLQTENETMQFGLGKMKSLLPQAEGDLGQAANFWGPLLNGNRNAQMSAVGPEVSNISSQYQAARKAAAEFSGRGGGRMAGLQSSRFQQVGATTNLLNSLKPKAAEGMTDIGKILAQLGIDAGHLGDSMTGPIQGGINAQNQQQGQLGEGIGKILGTLLTGSKGGGGGYSGGPSKSEVSSFVGSGGMGDAYNE